MATATKASKAETLNGFEIVDESEIQFPTREKEGLRQAMENLPVGKSLITGLTVSGENPNTKDDRNALARVRQKGQDIQKSLGLRRAFSVKVDVENRIIVSRNEGVPVGAEDVAEGDDEEV